MDSHRITNGDVPAIKRNPWADNFFRPLLVLILIMSFNLSVVNLVRIINPEWNGIFLLIGMFITTIEAIFSYRLLHTVRARDTSVFRYRVAEWVLLVILLKLLSFADKPVSFIWENLRATWWNPFDGINLEFYVILLLGFLSWLVATETIADFDKLHDPFTFRYDTIVPLERLKARFFWGGLLLVFISGVSQVILRLGASTLSDLTRPTIEGIIINVLVYFVLGLVLLSQANLARLTTSWRIHKIEVSPGLVRQWARYGLIFLGLVSVIVFFLPTHYTMGFLESAGLIVGMILSSIMLIFQLFLLLITLPFIWLMRLLGLDALPAENPASEPLAPPENPAQPPAGMFPWLDALRSLIFWLVAIAGVLYLLRVYLLDRPELLAALLKFRPFALLVKLGQLIWDLLQSWGEAGLDLFSERIRLPGVSKQGEALTGRRWRWFGRRNLSARERILRYYLNILKRAEKRKLGRKTSETPYEYEPNLEQAMPEVETDVQHVTDVFVRARYSREDFDDEKAAQIKEQWLRIRKSLRRAR